MASDSKEKVVDTIYETKDDTYAFDRSPSAVSNVEDEGAIPFDDKGLPSDPEQYAIWRRGVTKLDWRAVPPLGLLWLANFIDRVSHFYPLLPSLSSSHDALSASEPNTGLLRHADE